MSLEKSPVREKPKFTRKAIVDPITTPLKVEFIGEKDLDLDELVASARKYVKGCFIPRDEDESLLEVNDWIPMPKDITDVIGTKGIPCGLITMAYGKKDCGKTTFATEALIQTQKEGGIAILLDTENKYNLKRASKMGLDAKKLFIIQAVTIEDAFDKFVTIINLIKSAKERAVSKEFEHKGKTTKIGDIFKEEDFTALSPKLQKNFITRAKYADRKVCCVWDSLGATPSEWEMDDTKTDFAMAAAKVIKGRLRKVVRYIRDSKVAFVIINQVYANTNSFGKKTTPYGGSGPEYHSAIILEFVQVGRIRPSGGKSGEDFCGIRSQIECVKNHLSQPFKRGEVQIDWKGFVTGDRSPEYAPEGWESRKDESLADTELPKEKKRRDSAKS